MASSSIIFLAVLVLVLSPTALSATCKSHKFSTPNKSFATCADLPHLSATLHYSLNSDKSALSMAFTAPPAKPSGWVAWAINPTATGMTGAQALLAYKSPNGSVAVSTLSIQSHSSLTPGPLSLKVSDIAGEASSSTITIFATWQLPSKSAGSVNMVWQVGPAVNGGVPVKHDFAQANLLSKSKLVLLPAGPASSPAESPSDGATSPVAKTTGSVAPSPASGKNAAGEGFTRSGAWLALFVMAAFGFLF